jgi:hypothetical protein
LFEEPKLLENTFPGDDASFFQYIKLGKGKLKFPMENSISLESKKRVYNKINGKIIFRSAFFYISENTH